MYAIDRHYDIIDKLLKNKTGLKSKRNNLKIKIRYWVQNNSISKTAVI